VVESHIAINGPKDIAKREPSVDHETERGISERKLNVDRATQNSALEMRGMPIACIYI